MFCSVRNVLINLEECLGSLSGWNNHSDGIFSLANMMAMAAYDFVRYYDTQIYPCLLFVLIDQDRYMREKQPHTITLPPSKKFKIGFRYLTLNRCQ